MDPFKPRPQPKALDAEAIALKAVAFIAADEDLLPRFVALTGCGGDDLAARLAEPAFLGGVLDFILGHEATVLAFAASADLPPEILLRARARLP